MVHGSLADRATDNNVFLVRQKHVRTLAGLIGESSSNGKRRSVIVPRLCYFARQSRTGVLQRLCLPYDDQK